MAPASMKTIHVARPGGPEALETAVTGIPRPGPGQVLVKVAAAGLNRLDILQRKGLYPPPPGESEILGVEIAGEVVEAAPGVEQPRPGDRICALIPGGGYAQYALADAAACLPVPADLDLVQAASLPEAAQTVWSNVVERGGLKRGECFLVHGGASGIGSMAIQVARTLGAVVYATAGSDEKCEFCRGLGADLTVNYQSQDFVEVLQAAGDGVDVILDMVGGDYLNRNIRLAAPEARIVMIAAIRGYKAEVDLLSIMRKRLILTGSTLRSRSLDYKRALAARVAEHIWPLLNDGRVKPVVFRTFPLEQAAEAHRLMESHGHMGKIVLTVE